MLAVSVVGFAVAWWLGCHLLARDPRKPLLRRTSAGLLAYAAAVATSDLAVVGDVMWGLPALAWTGVLLRLPVDRPVSRADRWWSRVWLPGGLVALAVAGWWGDPVVSAAVSVVLGTGLAAGFAVAWRWRRHGRAGRNPVAAVLVITVLFGIGLAALASGTDLLPGWVLPTLVGVDLIALGVVIAWGDSVDEGHLLRPDLTRSGLLALGVTGLFAGQVCLAMATGPGATVALTWLLYGCVAAAVAVQVLAAPMNRWLDRLTLSSEVERERVALRDAMEALPRRSTSDDLDPEEFTRAVRRALRDYADLGRLVASPLTALPAVSAGLSARGAADTPLERATELKTLLREGIERLKPEGEFGLTDEWRLFNSLYFVYVVGLRPYSQRARHDGLDERGRQVLQWFRVAVPQRSLHNWQNSAARLVADAIREKTGAL